jgi:hypothetical protein
MIQANRTNERRNGYGKQMEKVSGQGSFSASGLMRALALTAFLLLSPGIARSGSNWWEQAPPPVVHGKVMPSHWWEEVKRSSERYHVNPFLVAAVAWIEGNGWEGDRIGNSPYWGPMGINEQCWKIPRWKLYDDLANIELGTRGLSGDPQAALKRYNAEWFKGHYMRDIMALERQLEREARVEVGLTSTDKGSYLNLLSLP